MDREAARHTDGAQAVGPLPPRPARVDAAVTGLSTALVFEHSDASGGVRLGLHRTAGAPVGALRWALLYGGTPIGEGMLPAGHESARADVSGLEEWMEDRALSLRVRSDEVPADGDGAGVQATCVRPAPRPPTRAEAAARRRWARLKGDGTLPARGKGRYAGSRQVTLWLPPRSDVDGASPRRRTRRVNVYRQVADLLLERLGPLGRDADRFEAPADRPAPGDP